MIFKIYKQVKILQSFLSFVTTIVLLVFFIDANAQCNNYLYVAEGQSGVQIGKLDVGGNQITVEAVFKRTEPYTRGLLFAGDLVSKHSNSSNCNYLLRPNGAAITTVNGFSSFDTDCEIQLNKSYHVALVYDGSVLKFYRNGVLKGSSIASGNLVTNNLITTIGSCAFFPNVFDEDFRGNINEVRIWNIARTQEQIIQYLTTSLPDPPTQIGLLAYYQFDNLLNKQGNTAWNGSILGNASINANNTDCTNTLTDVCFALPLKLVSFDGYFNPNKFVDVSFSTTNTDNVSTISIERKYGSESFSIIKTLAAINGNALNKYHYYDYNIASANAQIFYRLKITDYSGAVSYSKILMVVIKQQQTILVFPNPVKNTITISGLENKSIIKIISTEGKLVKQLYANANSMTIETSTLAKGIYIVQYNNGEKAELIKIIKE